MNEKQFAAFMEEMVKLRKSIDSVVHLLAGSMYHLTQPEEDEQKKMRDLTNKVVEESARGVLSAEEVDNIKKAKL
jgi:hypothetical protein